MQREEYNTHNPETNEPDRKERERRRKRNRDADGTARSTTTASKTVNSSRIEGSCYVSITFSHAKRVLLKLPSLETQELSQARAFVGLRLTEIVAGGLQMAEALLDDVVDAVTSLGGAFQILDSAHTVSGHGALE